MFGEKVMLCVWRDGNRPQATATSRSQCRNISSTPAASISYAGTDLLCSGNNQSPLVQIGAHLRVIGHCNLDPGKRNRKRKNRSRNYGVQFTDIEGVSSKHKQAWGPLRETHGQQQIKVNQLDETG